MTAGAFRAGHREAPPRARRLRGIRTHPRRAAGTPRDIRDIRDYISEIISPSCRHASRSRPPKSLGEVRLMTAGAFPAAEQECEPQARGLRDQGRAGARGHQGAQRRGRGGRRRDEWLALAVPEEGHRHVLRGSAVQQGQESARAVRREIAAYLISRRGWLMMAGASSHRYRKDRMLSLYLPCTFPVPSLYLPHGGRFFAQVRRAAR